MKAYFNHFLNFTSCIRQVIQKALTLSGAENKFLGGTLTAALAFSISTVSSAIAQEQTCHFLDPQEITLAMTEPQLYFNDIELIPEISGETPPQWQGYRVGFLRPDSWVSQFGLETGDLITAVNETSIKNLEAFNQAIKTIPQLEQFSLTIARNAATLQLHFLYGAQAQCPSSHGEEA